MSDQRFVVEASQAGERLDKFVIAVVPGLGRKGARRLFEEGRVRINGKRPRKGDLARQGDQVVIAMPETRGAKPADGLSFNPDLLPKGAVVPPHTVEQLQKLENQLRERDEKLSALLSGKKALNDELNERLWTGVPNCPDLAREDKQSTIISKRLKASDWKKAWEQTLAAAQKEGRVVVAAPPDAEVRQALPGKTGGPAGTTPRARRGPRRKGSARGRDGAQGFRCPVRPPVQGRACARLR